VDFHLQDPRTGARIGERSARGALEVPADDKVGTEEELISARQGRVVGETIQFIDPGFQVSERNAISLAARDLADKLVSQLANGW